MSFSFSHMRRWLAPLLCVAACGPLAGCRVLGQGTQPAEHESRHGPIQPFTGTWSDGHRSQVTVAPDGSVTGTLFRPTAGLVFDRSEAAGVVNFDVAAGAAPVRLEPAGRGQGVVVVHVRSAAGPAETLTLTFRLNHGGDRLRVLARSERRNETYQLTRGGTPFVRAQ
jgi:hypothetical protein